MSTPLASTIKHIVAAVERQGFELKTVLCAGNVPKLSKPMQRALRVSRIVVSDHSGQWQRLWACYRNATDALKDKRIEWFIRSRPDAVYFSNLVDLRHVSKQAAHMRLRACGKDYCRKRQLTVEHFAWSWWLTGNGGSTKPDKECVVGDDQFAVLPAEDIAYRYFGRAAPKRLKPNKLDSGSWVKRKICQIKAPPEVGFTEYLLSMQVPIEAMGVAFRLVRNRANMVIRRKDPKHKFRWSACYRDGCFPPLTNSSHRKVTCGGK